MFPSDNKSHMYTHLSSSRPINGSDFYNKAIGIQVGYQRDWRNDYYKVNKPFKCLVDSGHTDTQTESYKLSLVRMHQVLTRDSPVGYKSHSTMMLEHELQVFLAALAKHEAMADKGRYKGGFSFPINFDSQWGMVGCDWGRVGVGQGGSTNSLVTGCLVITIDMWVGGWWGVHRDEWWMVSGEHVGE